ncbi:MAG TPA: PAS domain S-box protein [Waterburya sp.]|jgi:PAS domain S-box-containing protein
MTGVNSDYLTQQIQDMHQRLAQLQQRIGESSSLRLASLPEQEYLETIAAAFEELSVTVEELRVANEELHQQNEHLSAAQQTVELQRQRYQELFEFAPDGYLVTDLYGTIQEANRAASTLLNYPQQFLVGKPFPVYVIEEERRAFRTKLNQLCQGDGVHEWEVGLKPRKQPLITAAIRVAAIQNQDGNPVGLCWLVHDITQRKQTELELRQANERLQLAATALDGMIYDWDIEKNTIARTHGLLESLGYRPEEVDLTPEWWQERIHPEDKKRVLQDLPNDLANFSRFSTEYRIVGKDNQYLHVCDRGLKIKNDSGQTVRVVGSTVNITERKRAQEQAQRTAAEIGQIFNMLPCFVWKFCRSTFQFIYASEVITELSGISRQAFLQNPHLWDERVDAGHESQEALRIAWEAITNGEPYRVVYLFHTLHRGGRWFEVTARPSYQEGVLYYYGSTTDITERKQAEEAFQKSASLLHTVVTHAPIVLYALDAEGRFTLSEGKGLEAVGLQPGEVVGQSVFELHHYQSYMLEHLRRVLAGAGETWVGEINDVLFENRALPLRDEAGQVIGLIGVATDVTQRLRAEEALQRLNTELENRVTERTAELEKLNEQLLVQIAERVVIEAALYQREQEFRALVENAPDIIERFDRELRHLYVNPAIEQVTGKLPSEFIGKTNQELGLSDPNLSLWEQALSVVFQTGQQEQFEFSLVTNQGLKYYQTRLVPEWAADGTPVSVLGISRDITDHKLALEALRESEERFRQLAENIDAVFWMGTVVDRPRCFYISPAYEQIWCRTRESFYANPMSWLEMVHPDDRDRVFAAIYQQLPQQATVEVEYRLVRDDGAIRWIRDRGFTIPDEDGKVYRIAGIAEDITSRKLAELEIQKALQRERELGELKARFVSMTSHEFRTPLTTIHSSAQMLERYRHRLPEEKQLTHLGRIQAAVERMTDMLNDILLLGKAEAGKLEFSPTPLDLVQWCRHLVEDLQLVNKNQQIIHFTYHNNCTTAAQGISEGDSSELNPSLLLLDEKLLRHILGNLLSNALKYSPPGSTVKFDVTCLDEQAIFQIQDQGIGIPPEDQSRLFESFYRAGNVDTVQGTGLGLAIVKQCVDLHRGEITFTSEVGKGTMFTVILPLGK